MIQDSTKSCLNAMLKSPSLKRLYGHSTKLSFRASRASLPCTRHEVGRDPESRKLLGNQNILDPGSHLATPGFGRDDELRQSLLKGRRCFIEKLDAPRLGAGTLTI